MIAAELISEDILPIQHREKGKVALMVMNDHFVRDLPVLDDTKFVGIISENILLDFPLTVEVGKIVAKEKLPYVLQDEHLFNIMSKMSEHQLTVMPVLKDHQSQIYLGAIKQEDILNFYANHFSFQEPGSIIVLQMPARDYSLGNISRIIESEEAHILCSFVTRDHVENTIILTVKVDSQELNRIIASLERHKYAIKAKYQESRYFENLQDRYDALMHYLNM